jgi:hypothetical protein
MMSIFDLNLSECSCAHADPCGGLIKAVLAAVEAGLTSGVKCGCVF